MTGKVAIVTGASRGIGRAIALRLALQGASCVLCARTVPDDLDVVALDLRNPEAPDELVRQAIARFGRIDIVVNNAGATKRAEFMDLSEEDWSDGFALKFFGSVRLARAAWPYLKATGGSVVNIAGVGGRTPGSAFAVGGSVNAALLSFTKSLAETGIRDGVQVNAVNPGTVRTGRLQARLKSFGSESELIAADRVTRIGEPADIANLVAFIVSPEGRFLHGALIDIDGGFTKTI